MVQSYNILGRYTNQCLCLCSHAWPVEVSHGKIRVRRTTPSSILGILENLQLDATQLQVFLCTFAAEKEKNRRFLRPSGSKRHSRAAHIT